jgi:hypothetical protein
MGSSLRLLWRRPRLLHTDFLTVPFLVQWEALTRLKRSLINGKPDLIRAKVSRIDSQTALTPSQLRVIDVQRKLIVVQPDLIRAKVTRIAVRLSRNCPHLMLNAF